MSSHSPSKYEYLKVRSLVVQAIRDFFSEQNFLEVDTPIRCPAIIPEANIDPVKSDGWYLQASPELNMKQLLSNGFEQIFQICKTFRKDETGPLHLTEFTLLEWYCINSTYMDLMTQCEGLINYIAQKLGMKETLTYQGKTIDLDTPWERLEVKKAFEKYSDTPMNEALEKDQFDEIISFKIEPNLGTPKPSFLLNYPPEQASLAKLTKDNQSAQRVELYMAGIELANGFTELTDPTEQKKRFIKENQIRVLRGEEPLPMPTSFLKALETMPNAAGMALGVDRLAMIFANAPTINDVVAFTPV